MSVLEVFMNVTRAPNALMKCEAFHAFAMLDFHGQTCERHHKKVGDFFGSFQRQGPCQMARNQGDKIMYMPGYPGYMYDGPVEQERQPV